MEFIYSQTILLGLLLFIALHFASAFTKGILSKVLSYVNIGLHIIFIIPMMTFGIPIEEGVHIYMGSLLVYTTINTVRYGVRSRRLKETASYKEAEAVTEPSSAKSEAEKPKPEAEKAKPVAEKPKPVAEKPKAEAEKPKAEAEKPKPEAEKPKPDAEKPKPDAEKPKPETAKEKKPSARELRRLAREEKRRVVADANPVKATEPKKFRFEPVTISDAPEKTASEECAGGDGK